MALWRRDGSDLGLRRYKKFGLLRSIEGELWELAKIKTVATSCYNHAAFIKSPLSVSSQDYYLIYDL
jgi:hypothetical protein